MIATRPPPEVVEQIAARDSIHIPHDEKVAFSGDAASSSDGDDEFPVPTAEEKVSLRKVSDDLSFVAFALCLVEFAERASYYGAQNIFSNFVEFPLPAGMLLSHVVLVLNSILILCDRW
jgi:hypothetical protein